MNLFGISSEITITRANNGFIVMVPPPKEDNPADAMDKIMEKVIPMAQKFMNQDFEEDQSPAKNKEAKTRMDKVQPLPNVYVFVEWSEVIDFLKVQIKE